jgi:hypothetical protein
MADHHRLGRIASVGDAEIAGAGIAGLIAAAVLAQRV